MRDDVILISINYRHFINENKNKLKVTAVTDGYIEPAVAMCFDNYLIVLKRTA